MKVYNILIIGLITLFAFSCKTNKKVTNLDKDEVRFSLSKSACFGKCPTYKLFINQNGYATLEGIANMDKLGVYGKQLSKDQLKALVSEFENSEFSQFLENYKSQMTDLPAIKIGYHDGTEFKTVSGKEDRPKELMQLQFSLEKIADSGGWTLLKSQEEIDKTKKPEVVNIVEEIIIEPNPGTHMAKWLESMDKYGVRLIKKIAPTLNYYLITYNKDNITGEEFLKVLQRDENIKSAEFNKKTSRRRG